MYKQQISHQKKNNVITLVFQKKYNTIISFNIPNYKTSIFEISYKCNLITYQQYITNKVLNFVFSKHDVQKIYRLLIIKQQRCLYINNKHASKTNNEIKTNIKQKLSYL